MFSLTAFLNKILICRYKNYFKKYQRASQSIERVQSDKLKSYINKNAHTVSPTINSGVTITVPSGAKLVIL